MNFKIIFILVGFVFCGEVGLAQVNFEKQMNCYKSLNPDSAPPHERFYYPWSDSTHKGFYVFTKNSVEYCQRPKGAKSSGKTNKSYDTYNLEIGEKPINDYVRLLVDPNETNYATEIDQISSTKPSGVKTSKASCLSSIADTTKNILDSELRNKISNLKNIYLRQVAYAKGNLEPGEKGQLPVSPGLSDPQTYITELKGCVNVPGEIGELAQKTLRDEFNVKDEQPKLRGSVDTGNASQGNGN